MSGLGVFGGVLRLNLQCKIRDKREIICKGGPMTKLRTQLAGSQLNTVVLLFMVFFTGVLFRLLVVPWSSFLSGDPP